MLNHTLMYYVYFLELSNNDIYVGYSYDLKARIDKHRSGNVSATSKLLPIKLRSYIAVDSKERAVNLEKYFKTGSGIAFAKKRL